MSNEATVLSGSKYEVVRSLVEADCPAPGAVLLDVGCRYGGLAGHVAGLTTYMGVDRFLQAFGGPFCLADLQRGLPFADRSCDYVVALDVLEHVEDLTFGLCELLRVAQRLVIVVVPNMGYLGHRVDFLVHGYFAGTSKYDLKIDGGGDRHRWLFTQGQSDVFMREFAAGHGCPLDLYYLAEGSRQTRLVRYGRLLRLPASLWVWKCLYVFRRAGTESHG